MRIFYELRYTVIIEIVWTFYLKSVRAKFKKYLKHISWVISGIRSSKLSCNPRHPSRNISCNHRHHLLQPSWRRIFSTSNNQKTRVDSDINSDYKASSFDKLSIRSKKWDTAGFVGAHQRKYWNALTVGRGHADDGCSCNHHAVPPSGVHISTQFASCDLLLLHWYQANHTTDLQGSFWVWAQPMTDIPMRRYIVTSLIGWAHIRNYPWSGGDEAALRNMG